MDAMVKPWHDDWRRVGACFEAPLRGAPQHEGGGDVPQASASFLPRRGRGKGTMRSMVEGAAIRAASFIRPLHRVPRSPSPALRARNGGARLMAKSGGVSASR